MSDKVRVYSTKPSTKRRSTGMYGTRKEVQQPSFRIDESASAGVSVIPRGTITTITMGGNTFELLNTETLRELERAFGKQDHRVKLSTEVLRTNAKIISDLQQRVAVLEQQVANFESQMEQLRNFGLYGNGTDPLGY